MSPEDRKQRGGGDNVKGSGGGRPFETSAMARQIGEAVRHLNSTGKENEAEYQRSVEGLRGRGRDVLGTVDELFRQARSGDSTLRWNLLHVLGDTGDEGAADFLVRAALAPLPKAEPEQGCEGDRDAEMLVSTMAVHALQRIAGRHQQASQALLRIVSERPARPILIEAVKAANELGLRERVREVLPKEDQWMLDIRRARPEEVRAEPEREDTKERGNTPPKRGQLYTAPQAPDTGKER